MGRRSASDLVFPRVGSTNVFVIAVAPYYHAEQFCLYKLAMLFSISSNLNLHCTSSPPTTKSAFSQKLKLLVHLICLAENLKQIIQLNSSDFLVELINSQIKRARSASFAPLISRISQFCLKQNISQLEIKVWMTNYFHLLLIMLSFIFHFGNLFCL